MGAGPTTAAAMKLPLQPLYRDAKGVIRFRGNAVVQWLVDSRIVNLNGILIENFPQADVEQFWQLLGYSIAGYAELSFVSDETYQAVDDAALEVRRTAVVGYDFMY